MNALAGNARRLRQAELDLTTLRWPGAAMLTAGVMLPLLGHPGVGCPLRAATGIPCPLCGMSTSVEAAVRFRFGDALRANPVGLAAAAAAVVLLLVNHRVKLRFPAAALYVLLLGMWLFELVRFGTI